MKQTQTSIAELARSLIEEYTFHHEALRIEFEVDGIIDRLTITPHQADYGRILGKFAKHFLAFRVLLTEVYARQEQREIIIEMPRQAIAPQSERHGSFQPRPDWPRARVLGKIERLAKGLFDPVIMEWKDHSEFTAVVLHVSRVEPWERVARLSGALKVMANLIGLPNGRRILLVVDRTLDRTDAQPKTAAGRYAPEL